MQHCVETIQIHLDPVVPELRTKPFHRRLRFQSQHRQIHSSREQVRSGSGTEIHRLSIFFCAPQVSVASTILSYQVTNLKISTHDNHHPSGNKEALQPAVLGPDAPLLAHMDGGSQVNTTDQLEYLWDLRKLVNSSITLCVADKTPHVPAHSGYMCMRADNPQGLWHVSMVLYSQSSSYHCLSICNEQRATLWWLH
jgi:hypothetical protein